jgi:ribosomal protein S4
MATLKGSEAIAAYQASLPAGVVDPLDDLSEEDKTEFEFATVAIQRLSLRLDRIITQAGMAASNNEARRLLKAGAVDVDGERALVPDFMFLYAPENPTFVLRVGKKQKRIRITD